MLSLILFRHGKSDWDAGVANDHQRPLADRGKVAAQVMGRLLTHTRQVPDLAISSSALRARETLRIASTAGAWSSETRIDGALYETDAAAVVQWVAALDIPISNLLLTGHEPTWSDLAGQLIGCAAIRVPTAAMARIDFTCDSWSDVTFDSGELRWLMTPKLTGKLEGAQ